MNTNPRLKEYALFSQEIKLLMKKAEELENSELQFAVMKLYLDVQRLMKKEEGF